mmetsp:Transcript_9353/g.13652  ORF Transcript_9353/g.13652 Transcript_9353/m.13652 type:complete len:204 (+) Transcript_9353:111-722(+)|eukprot:CAMPEP_0195508764 /NCGR_PEP_ID=MMETSP0794_2-20130614/1894_1 /TAXON_ID=515487 /ORGANISM="Stephanopyxis turris, Strain CCMP 815" /LENGTH=203 /DNA_ID=CAMNT_0040635815 /DNA_START=102 /DNA_END=713 /DNA_ORIENTATION=-
MPKEKAPGSAAAKKPRSSASLDVVAEWSAEKVATWLRSLPLGHKTKAIADYAKKNLVSGLILVSNSRSPEDLVETFGTTMSKPIARAVIYSLVENGASNTKRKSAAAANGDDAPPAKKGKGLKAGKKSSRKRGPRPPTAYLLFCRDKRNEFNGAGTLPTGKGEALKVLGAAWSSASNHVKARYKKLAALAKTEFANTRAAQGL